MARREAGEMGAKKPPFGKKRPRGKAAKEEKAEGKKA